MKPDNIKSTTDIDAIKKYTVPSLVEGVDWYIKFYAYDPAQQKMRRKKIKLNHIEKIGQRRRYADGLMKRLIQKLEDGWNPWIESENEKAYHTFTDTCNHYRKIILNNIVKEKDLDKWNKYNDQLIEVEKRQKEVAAGGEKVKGRFDSIGNTIKKVIPLMVAYSALRIFQNLISGAVWKY